MAAKSKYKAGYVDGFVLVVPKSKVAEYKKMAGMAEKMWMEHGALSYKECIGEELDPDMGGYSFLPFSQMAKIKRNETVWFSYIEYKNKRHRDRVNKIVMKEMMEMHKDDPNHMKKMPFDMKRMAWGGFKVEVSS